MNKRWLQITVAAVVAVVLVGYLAQIHSKANDHLTGF